MSNLDAWFSSGHFVRGSYMLLIALFLRGWGVMKNCPWGTPMGMEGSLENDRAVERGVISAGMFGMDRLGALNPPWCLRRLWMILRSCVQHHRSLSQRRDSREFSLPHLWQAVSCPRCPSCPSYNRNWNRGGPPSIFWKNTRLHWSPLVVLSLAVISLNPLSCLRRLWMILLLRY